MSPAYRIGPDAAYDEPLTIRVPLATTTDANLVVIYYYSESELHPGWHRSGDVEGWLSPESVGVTWEGRTRYLEFQVQHSGTFQLGVPAE